MREVDRACDGYFSAPPRALSPPAPAKSAALAQNRFALDPAGSVPARAGHTVEHFLDIGCAPGGFAQFLLDHSPRWQGIGLTLEEGGHLMDERFMADARRSVTSGGIAERFRLIYGDVTESPAHMRFLPDGTRMPVGSDAPPQFDLVIAGARSSKSEGSKGTRRSSLHAFCTVATASYRRAESHRVAPRRHVLTRCREDPSQRSASRLLGQPEAGRHSGCRREYHPASHTPRNTLFSEGHLS